jgi:hypothetical protein
MFFVRKESILGRTTSGEHRCFGAFLSFLAETNRFPGDSWGWPGGRPRHFFHIFGHRQKLIIKRASASTWSGDASATRLGRRARPRRLRGRARAALMDAGCQRVCCFCGGGVFPAALRLRAPVPHTGAQGCMRPATCTCALRPLCARARARGSPPGTGVARHTHVLPLILSVLPAGSTRGVCARGRPPIPGRA